MTYRYGDRSQGKTDTMIERREGASDIWIWRQSQGKTDTMIERRQGASDIWIWRQESG